MIEILWFVLIAICIVFMWLLLEVSLIFAKLPSKKDSEFYDKKRFSYKYTKFLSKFIKNSSVSYSVTSSNRRYFQLMLEQDDKFYFWYINEWEEMKPITPNGSCFMGVKSNYRTIYKLED